jgi:2'-5' RNA ligase
MQEWERLVNLLHEADALQQRLLHDIDSEVCYEFHITLDRIAEDLEQWAAAEQRAAEVPFDQKRFDELAAIAESDNEDGDIRVGKTKAK